MGALKEISWLELRLDANRIEVGTDTQFVLHRSFRQMKRCEK
jgi:hypothetical protein